MSIEITNKYRKNYRNINYDCKDIDGFEFATVKNFSDSVLAICRASLGTMRKKVNYFRTVYCEALKTLRKRRRTFLNFCPLRRGEGGGTKLSGLFPLKDFFFDCRRPLSIGATSIFDLPRETDVSSH